MIVLFKGIIKMPKDYNFKYPFYTVKGPFAVIRACVICGHIEKVVKGKPGVGRGYGMREGNRARGRMIQHIKEHEQIFGLYEIYNKEARKVGEIDVSGWTMFEVLKMLRAVDLNGRRARYRPMTGMSRIGWQAVRYFRL